MPTSSLIVEFETPTSKQTHDFNLSLDSEKIAEVYGQTDKSSFAPNESAYLKLIRSSNEAYQLFVTAGKISTVIRNTLYPVSETVIFAASSLEDLNYIPIKNVTWDWIGRSPGTPLFSGKGVKIESPSNVSKDSFVPIGVLQCSYNVNGDCLKLTVLDSDMSEVDKMDVLVIAIQGENKAYTQVSFDKGTGGAPIPINLLVKDFCSDANVVDVDVYLDGSFIGKTNGNGKIYLGDLVPNTIHDLKMTKSGYIDSDLDVLYNDSFTVPTE